MVTSENEIDELRQQVKGLLAAVQTHIGITKQIQARLSLYETRVPLIHEEYEAFMAIRHETERQLRNDEPS